jgi:hypothetical protein
VKFRKHSLARQALPDGPVSAAGVSPRLASDSASTQRALELLIDERCNVMVTCASGERLSQWGRAVAAALRSRSDVAFELHMPASADNLVARFNDAMGSLSLQSARADAYPCAASLRVVLVADPHALLSPEGLLFAKLVTDFPAAGFRLLILADAGAESTNRLLREVFGRRVRQLSLDSPALDRNSRLPFTGAVETLGATAFVQPGGVSSASSAARDARCAVLPSDRADRSMFVPVRRTGSAQRLTVWAAGIVSLLLVSILVIVLVNRDRTPAGISESAPRAVPRSTFASAATQSAGTTGSPPSSERAGDSKIKGQRP